MGALLLGGVRARFGLRDWEQKISHRPCIIALDAKSVYDHLSKPTASDGKDKRAAIDLQYVRETLARDNSNIRWVDGRHQLADDLTKAREGDLIRGAMKEGTAMLVAELDALRRRERERAARRLAIQKVVKKTTGTQRTHA